jgi:hypothetical protein
MNYSTDPLHITEKPSAATIQLSGELQNRPLALTVRRSAATIQLSDELQYRPLAHYSKDQCCHHTDLRWTRPSPSRCRAKCCDYIAISWTKPFSTHCRGTALPPCISFGELDPVLIAEGHSAATKQLLSELVLLWPCSSHCRGLTWHYSALNIYQMLTAFTPQKCHRKFKIFLISLLVMLNFVIRKAVKWKNKDLCGK